MTHAARQPGLLPTAATRLTPPQPASWTVSRPRLEDLVTDVLSRRLTVVSAGAGFGKTTLLTAWAGRTHTAWYSMAADDRAPTVLVGGVIDALRLRVPGIRADLATALRDIGGPDTDADDLYRARAYATAIADDLAVRLKRDLVLVLDDVDVVGDAPGAVRFIEDLVRQLPATVHAVLAARSEVPFPIERLRGQGQVLELGGQDLALTVDETRGLVGLALQKPDRGLARELQEACGGWPAVTALAAEAMRGLSGAERSAAIGRLQHPGGSLFHYLASEVFDREPQELQRLLAVASLLGRISAPLCEAVGQTGATDAIHSLSRRGVYLQADPSAPGWFTVLPLVREFTLGYRPLPDAEGRAVHRAAASWYAAAGMSEAAVQQAIDAEDPGAVHDLLRASGPQLLGAGRAELVLRATTLHPPDGDKVLEGLMAEAHQLNGDWDAALRHYQRIAGNPPMRARLAWRMGLIHHLRGELARAVESYASAAETDDEPVERALLLAWWASACWLQGDPAATLDLASRALELGRAAGDHRSMAAAHTALAMHAAMTGDRAANDGHYLRALEHAERATDVLQMIRIHSNRGSMLIEEGLYAEAVVELDAAIELAGLGGYAAFRALGLSNRGEARMRLGNLEEALADLQAARELYARMGSSLVAYPLSHLGELHRMRGAGTQALASLTEAMRLVEAAHDVQGIVQTASRMAELLAGDDSLRAEEMADRALAFPDSMDRVMAMLAASTVRVRAGDASAARAFAQQAREMASQRRDRAGVARANEMLAITADGDGASLLDLAAAVWDDIGNPIAAARNRALRAIRYGGPPAAAAAHEAIATLQGLGARGVAREVQELAGQVPSPPAVAIRTLGGFSVSIAGEPVGASAWQSRKARDLLKILVAHRGRPVTREYLMDTLWPEEDPTRLSNRLSVALATVRVILDPERARGAEPFIVAEGQSVRLDLGRVAVDVEQFLSAAADALRLCETSADAAGRALVDAEALYTGDFLEEEPYEEWPIALREEARAAYASVARALAEDASGRGDQEAGVRYYLRLLERDPFDEGAHLGLVRCLISARRHGDARRRYQIYSARMDELGVESAPFPGPAPG